MRHPAILPSYVTVKGRRVQLTEGEQEVLKILSKYPGGVQIHEVPYRLLPDLACLVKAKVVDVGQMILTTEVFKVV